MSSKILQDSLFQAGARELRSTYATMAAAAGIQPKTLQHIMGHAKSQLTTDIYVNQGSEGMQIASGQLENFLEKGRQMCQHLFLTQK